jgi:hypothetical protein
VVYRWLFFEGLDVCLIVTMNTTFHIPFCEYLNTTSFSHPSEFLLPYILNHFDQGKPPNPNRLTDLSLTHRWQMAGTKRQKESRIANLNKKKMKSTPSSAVMFDMSGPAGASPAVSVYDES